ncbi:MAG TPA: LOG family protein [Candidatus Hodarchaeales archaeon]|nr:LOG family protein [Candidatus Hodarchaeales archaeon]
MKKLKRQTVPVRAYKNLGFLNSKDARPIRILSEFLEPLSRFKYYGIKDIVVFFGSARIKPRKVCRKNLTELKRRANKSQGRSPALTREIRNAEVALAMSDYYEDATELARLVTKWSMSLREKNRFVVCSGGGPGIMEAANKGALLANGRSIGLNIGLRFEQDSNNFITPELNLEFHYFFMRKYWFMYLGKALIAFPGGFGTLDELMELLTLLQTGKIKKKMTVILYGRVFWEQIINFRRLEELGMVGSEDSELFKFADTPKAAFAILKDGLTVNYPENPF